ncbi:MAG TPA: hypothetical protein VIS99_12645, partial [Terrimicrobiaceae bacterium]
MNDRVREWFRRVMPSSVWRSRLGNGQGEGVEHLRAGQNLITNDLPQDSISLILQGRCASPDLPKSSSLGAGDVIDEAQGRQLKMRAMVDSDILRFPRQNLRRLLARWPAMLRSGAPSSLRTAPPPARRKGFGKILGLLPLSAEIPYEEFSLVCAETIVKETAEAVLYIKIGTALATNESKVPSAVSELDGVFVRRVDGGSSVQSLRMLSKLLDRARGQFSFTIVEATQETTVEALTEILRRAWSIYPILRQNGEDLFELNLLSREVRARGYGATPIKPLIFLAPGENAHGLSCYIEETVQWPVHSYLRKAGDGLRFTSNLRRLGREMCGCQVGLALSSGAARGLSHIGVLQVLEENGIEVD